ncbi:MAG: hypothetical protein QXQ47_02300 [Candidatus Bathyarchaeia archaeon]
MVRKQPIRFRIKKVIDALKEGKKTWSELEALGVPEKTLNRVLKDYLMYWDLVRKEGEYYVWFENLRVFKSRHEYELSVKHSRGLIPAFKKIMDVSASVEPKLYQAVKEHLKTGYPEIHHKLEKFETVYNSRFRYLFGKYKDRILTPDKFMLLRPVKVKKGRFFSNTELVPVPVQYIIKTEGANPDELKEIDELSNLLRGVVTSLETERVYKELVGDISLLILKIEMGEPLDGKCFLCPKIRIEEEC